MDVTDRGETVIWNRHQTIYDPAAPSPKYTGGYHKSDKPRRP
jgi:hypothetical protein